jgi:hypothetical protein
LNLDIANARIAYIIDGNNARCQVKSPGGYLSLSRLLLNRYTVARSKRPLPSVFGQSRISVAVHISGEDVAWHDNFKTQSLQFKYYFNVLKILTEVIGLDLLDISIHANCKSHDVQLIADSFNARLIDYGNEIQDFHALVTSEILIASMSGFSYLATLINRKAIKICPDKFWHRWPSGSIIFDGSTSSFLSSKLLTSINRLKRYSEISVYQAKCFWSFPPVKVMQNVQLFRDVNIDNIASVIKLIPTGSSNDQLHSIVDHSHVHSRKLYGCIVNMLTQQIETDSTLLDVNEVLLRPSVFLEFAIPFIDHVGKLNSIIKFFKDEYQEAIMGRNIVIPPNFPVALSEFIALSFHRSISFTMVSSPRIYFSDLMVFRIVVKGSAE